MMIEKIRRTACWILALFLISVISMGCGGVQKNPTTPQDWNKEKEKKSGEGTSAETEPGAPEIRQGASVNELMDTAKTSLEGGFIKNAAQAYSKAIESDKEKPDLALAYAITKIAGSVKEFSLLMDPGINMVYFNTPLIGRSEFLPSPLNEDDSYLLRIASLGTKYVTPYSAKPEKQTPPTTTPPGTPSGTTPAKPAASNGEKKPTGENPGGEIKPPTSPTGEGERQNQSVNNERKSSTAGITGSGDATSTGGQTSVGGTTSGGGGGLQYAGKTEQVTIDYLNLSKDIFPDLIKQYKDTARTYNSGYLNFDSVDKTTTDLKKIVDDIVDKMEYAKRNVEKDKFALELPFILDEKPHSVYRLYFRNYDYMIILGYMKLLQAELTYRSAYNSASGGMSVFTPPEDIDKDNKLTPAEYYPPKPYGDKKDKAKDILPGVSTLLSGSIETLVKSLDEFHNDSKLMSYAGNLLFPVNVDQFALDKIAAERDMYSDFEVLLTAGKGTRNFKTPTDSVKADVNLASLFGEKAPASVLALLPTFDATTLEPIVGADGKILPDPTWGDFLPGFSENFDVFRISSDITGILTNQGEPIKDVQIKLNAENDVKTDEKGKFTLKAVHFNELTGITVEVTAPGIPTSAKAQIRGAWISFDLSLVNQDMMSGTGVNPGGETIITTPGGSTTAPGAGDGSSSRIDQIRKEKEKNKDDSGKTETPEEPTKPTEG